MRRCRDRGAWGRSTGRDGAERRPAPLTMTDLVCGEIVPFPEYLRARAPVRHEQLRHPFDFAQGRRCPHMIVLTRAGMQTATLVWSLKLMTKNDQIGFATRAIH